MSFWFIALLTLYVLIFIGFTVAIFREAPKHGADVGPVHILVALVWPIWVIWYLITLAKDVLSRKN